MCSPRNESNNAVTSQNSIVLSFENKVQCDHTALFFIFLSTNVNLLRLERPMACEMVRSSFEGLSLL